MSIIWSVLLDDCMLPKSQFSSTWLWNKNENMRFSALFVNLIYMPTESLRKTNLLKTNDKMFTTGLDSRTGCIFVLVQISVLHIRVIPETITKKMLCIALNWENVFFAHI